MSYEPNFLHFQLEGKLKKLGFLLSAVLLSVLTFVVPSWGAGLTLTFPNSTQGFTANSWQSVATVTETTPAISGGNGGSIRVTVAAGTNGRLRLATTTNITAADSYTLSNFDDDSAGLATISFQGLVADVSTALASLEFQRITDTGTNTISVEATEGTGLVYDNRYYEVYTQAAISWSEAFKLAASKKVPSTVGGVFCQGYLATITSAEENQFAFSRVGADAWIGAADEFSYVNAALGASTYANQAAAEGKWFWVNGPERGVQFSQSNGTPTPVSSRYENWNTDEPNNSSPGEHAGQFTTGSSGGWNDLPLTSIAVSKLIVEYGGVVTTATHQSNPANVVYTTPGHMGDKASCIPAAVGGTVAASFSAVSASVPAAPSTVVATAGARQATLSWVVPTNGGSEITGYKIEVNNGSTWSTAVADTESTDASAVVTGLVTGTSYTFRVSAINAIGTSAASTASSAVTISGTVPGLPTNLAIAYSGYGSAKLSWSAPTDDGGVAISSYTVQYQNGGDWINLTPSGNSATVSNVFNNQAWSFRVAATNSVGTGSFATLANVPPTPYDGPQIGGGIAIKPVPANTVSPLEIEGSNLNQVTKVTIDGKEVRIVSQTGNKLVLELPALTPGVKDIVFTMGQGTLVHQDALVVREVTETSAATKVNAGSFKGYVALYAKGHEGKRFSAKVGKDWVVIPSLRSDFERIVEFTGAGFNLNIPIYIDRKLIETMELTTK